MGEKYTTINIDQKEPEFLSFDEDGSLDFDLKEENEDKDEDTDTEDAEDVSDSDGGDEEESQKRSKKSRQQDKRSKRESRSQRRIRELIEEREHLAQELENIKRQTKEQLSKTKTNARASKEAVRESLGSQVENIKKQLKKAIEEGDSESVVELQSSLHDTQIKLAAVSYELQGDVDEADEKEDKTNTQTKPRGPSPKALDWVKEHPEFNSDPVFHGAAMMVNNTLIREGYNPDSDDFYEELNDRLSTRFPEIFDNEDEDDVEYTGDASEDEDDIDEDQGTLNKNKTSKNKQSQSKKSKSRKPTTTVSGASRPAAGGANKAKSSRNTVRLSQEDVALAKKWGISLESFARRKKLYESRDKEAGEYTPIITG